MDEVSIEIIVAIVSWTVLVAYVFSEGFCFHKLEKTESIEKKSMDHIVIGYIYVYTCSKCGRIKLKKVKW